MFEASGSGDFDQTTPLTIGTQHSVLSDCHLDAKLQGLPHHLLDIGSREIYTTDSENTRAIFGSKFLGQEKTTVIFTLVFILWRKFSFACRISQEETWFLNHDIHSRLSAIYII